MTWNLRYVSFCRLSWQRLRVCFNYWESLVCSTPFGQGRQVVLLTQKLSHARPNIGQHTKHFLMMTNTLGRQAVALS